MATRRLYRRRFLNRPGHHAGAYAIADCSRVVELDFYAGDGSSATNALHKARLLREIVTEFSDAYELAIGEWRAQAAKETARN